MAVRETKKTSVRLLSHTANPVETVYVEWLQSRSDGPVPDPANVARSYRSFDEESCSQVVNEKLKAEVDDTFEKVVSMKIPIAETVDFVFLIEHCPIALREQIVRHRIGHRFAGRLGADTIPDLAESTFWSQTMRVMDMGHFATDGEYLLPESADDTPMPGQYIGPDPDCEMCKGIGSSKEYGPCKCIRRRSRSRADFYHEQMNWIQSAYKKLVESGMPIEDARNILPLGVQHRLTWKLSLSSLLHVLSKRSCWIAQLGMWEPIILGMVEELATKIHPFFRRLMDPPCIGADGKFKECVFTLENDNRIMGKDPYAPCPLYLNIKPAHAAAVSAMNRPFPSVKDILWKGWIHSNDPNDGVNGWIPIEQGPGAKAPTHRATELTVRGAKYEKLWGRSLLTGERKEPESLFSQKEGER